jgi:methyl-accepting chemotaxis protein
MVSVSDAQGMNNFTIGILGGGRGGSGLLDLFGENRVARVTFVADPNQAAPGILEAKRQGIPTAHDFESALLGGLPNFLFNVTGDPDLEIRVKERLRGTDTVLVAPGTSRMLVAVLQENSREVREEVTEVVAGIQKDLADSLEASSNIVSRINSIMSNMQMLALNASIEAAKAGVHGRGFTVVADHLGRSVEAVRNLTQEINAVNQNIIQVSKRTESVVEKLR